MLPSKNNDNGTIDSITPRDLLLGTGTRSLRLWPNVPMIPNGHQVEIGRTIGIMCPLSTPILLAIVFLIWLAVSTDASMGAVK